MYCLLFDLDNTLLPEDKINFISTISSDNSYSDILEKYIENLPPDIKLSMLLQNIPYPKGIISNASDVHIKCSLIALSIYSEFYDIIGGYNMNKLKPNGDIYNIALDNYNKEYPFETFNTTFIYFDDMEINLRIPNKLGWITVLIGDKKDYSHVDYNFENIYDALSGLTPLMSSGFLEKKKSFLQKVITKFF